MVRTVRLCVLNRLMPTTILVVIVMEALAVANVTEKE